jgi:hypothetical protein
MMMMMMMMIFNGKPAKTFLGCTTNDNRWILM